MNSRMRILALVLMASLLALPLHVWMESSAAPSAGHACQHCVSGGWAVVVTAQSLYLAPMDGRMAHDLPRIAPEFDFLHQNTSRAPPAA